MYIGPTWIGIGLEALKKPVSEGCYDSMLHVDKNNIKRNIKSLA